MAKRTTAARRLRQWLTSGLLLTAVGCGFPHDRYQSDPMFGSFNRPIVATPPIWTGGDPGVSPAWDAGSRMGLPSPDVPARANPQLERILIMPTFSGSIGFGRLFGSGGIERASGGSGYRSVSGGGSGARMIQVSQVGESAVPLVNAAPSANAITPRSSDPHAFLTSGASLEMPAAPVKAISPVQAMKDPRTVVSIEEGQSILQTCGAKTMTMESQPTGEWRFTCTMAVGDEMHKYESKSGEQIEAIRAVMWQLKNERK